MPEGTAEAVRALAFGHCREDLERAVPDLSPAWLDWLLERLSEAGLLEASAPRSKGVSIVGHGPLAEQVAAQVLAAGFARVALISAQVRPTAGVPRRSRLVADRLTAKFRATQVTARSLWLDSHEFSDDLVIVAGDECEPDRTVTERLLRENRAHLVVRVSSGAGLVGPLILPGRTPCLRCEDLHRCESDPAWPQILAQLFHQSSCPPPLVTGWAAITAALHAATFAAGHLPDSVGNVLELDPVDSLIRVRPGRSHSRCGCLALVA
ncbi:MAG: hypothetical protein IPL43_05410 [Micropruina sp.]|nr:hypothetical protein [Micropruina sp.]